MPEIKHIEVEMEFRALENEGEFEAILAKFNNIDFGGDKILPGAFAKSIKGGHRFPLLADHRSSQVVGGFKAKETDVGLIIRGEFNLDVQGGKENHSNAIKGNKTGFSIGFSVLESDITKTGVRLLKELKLHEGSIVTFPMNDKARLLDIKNTAPLADIKNMTTRELEFALRESGLSKSLAVKFASVLIDQRDSEESNEHQRDSDFLKKLNELNNKLKD